ncbi:MAG: ABC transporter ATP-binding protein [Paracoccaceae bacterium]
MIVVRNLRKTYDDLEALSGVDLDIAEGGIVGLLGQNGAGKTTLVEILEGLRQRSGGDVAVLGLDPERDGRRLRERLGVQLQAVQLPETLTPTETLRMFGAFYESAERPEPLLDRVGLNDKANAPNRTLSGGQRQRLAIAMAMVNDPDVILLDEPTSGLDPVSRRDLQRLLRELRDRNRLIVMTTHYLEEAEKLCDRVIVIDKGRIVADGSPGELSKKQRPEVHAVILTEKGFDETCLLATGMRCTHAEGPRRHYRGTDVPAALREIADIAAGSSAVIEDLRVSAPSLEQSYLDLVGPVPDQSEVEQ